MNQPINELIKYFTNASFEFTDLFVTSLKPHMQDNNRYTASHHNGLVMTLSGSANFSLNGECYALRKGVALHAGPDMEISIDVTSDKPWHYAVLHYEVVAGAVHLKNDHFAMDSGENHGSIIPTTMSQVLQFLKA